MKQFNFDYTIDDYKERLAEVCNYLFCEIDIDEAVRTGELPPAFIEQLGVYIMYAYDKEMGHKRITDNEQRQSQHIQMLKDELLGIKSYLIQEQVLDYGKFNDNETCKLIIENIKSYEEYKLLIDKVAAKNEGLDFKAGEIKKGINADITTCKEKLLEPVRTKQGTTRPKSVLANISGDIELYYSDPKFVQAFLREYNEIKSMYSKELFSDMYCACLDLEIAIKKCKFTSKQKVAISDYMNGINTNDIDLSNLKFAIIKIMKKLS